MSSGGGTRPVGAFGVLATYVESASLEERQRRVMSRTKGKAGENGKSSGG